MASEIIQSLWIGNRLSTLEQLSLRSFLAHGYEVHLFTYGELPDVPTGVVVRNGTEILPAEDIFVYRRGFGKGSPSAFSNLFRYKLLFERGGWWTDLDVVCLCRLPAGKDYYFGYEVTPAGGLHVGSAVMRLPVKSPVARDCFKASCEIDRRRVRWGQIGPRLVAEAVTRHALHDAVLSPNAFFPINYWDVKEFIKPETPCPHDSYCVHLWHAMWRKLRMNPDSAYHPQCMMEKWKAQFMPPPKSGRKQRKWPFDRVVPSLFQLLRAWNESAPDRPLPSARGGSAFRRIIAPRVSRNRQISPG